MDLKSKLKDLDEDQLDQLSEESELDDDGEKDRIDDSSIEGSDSETQEFDPTTIDSGEDDEGSEIEVDSVLDSTDQEFEAIPKDYLFLVNKYCDISDYKSMDLTYALASIIQFTNSSWKLCLNESAEINPTKGRHRSGSSDNKMASMFDWSYSDDSDEFDIMMTNKLVVTMLQQYIDDHDVDKLTDLSDDQRKYNLDSIKVVLILMISCNKYDFFPNLNLPKYAQKWILDVMQNISDTQDSVFSDWINYLNKTKNKVIAEKCIEVGYEFFKVDKAINTFGKYFTTDEIASIKKYPEVYAYFLECRDKFNKLSNGVNYKTLYPIFDITDDTFSKRKTKVINEFVVKYSEMAEDNEKAVEALKTLFLEQSNE